MILNWNEIFSDGAGLYENLKFGAKFLNGAKLVKVKKFNLT